ncbi:class I adenylate-forming enzyme family protein [Nocardia sp. CNY236]|uniref:class I adenylate-forming enzyme family protein n=1 Tax=Nocardia sp. CNY236 TaxID=1169152 RepID=UPI00048DD30B|nr:class I adenylate-forming enzyme family protein [Nocardia sp. CNY236]
MTKPFDPQVVLAQAMTELTGPGSRFEMVVEDVLGAPMPVMRRRATSLGAVLATSVEHGTRDYLVTTERRISFSEHAAAVAALATALRDRYGVGQGDRVGILAANTPEWVITFWAAQALGAIAVGYNAWCTPHEIARGIEHADPTVLVADAKRSALAAECDIRVPILTMEHDIPTLIADARTAPLPHTDVDEDDPAVILYTSGTSGRPKGVVHSHRNLLAVIDYHTLSDTLAATLTGASAPPNGRRFLLTSPLFHIASLHNLVVPRLATADTAVIHQGSFDVDRVLRLIEQQRITNWGAVPTMATRMLESDLSKYDLSSLTSFSLNSAPSSAALHQKLRTQLPAASNALVTSYGLTECSTAATVASPAEFAALPDTVGRPIIGVSVEIRDSAGQVVPDGVPGEICLRSPYVMLGYWNDEAATAAAITPDRWLRTGDIGIVEEGRLRLSGRRSDLILRGGENVYPAEIEQCLEGHPSVRECAVIGVPDPDLGQQVAAVIVVDNGTATTEDDLRAFTTERLAYYKVPARWRLTTSELPRNATGKVVRTELTM